MSTVSQYPLDPARTELGAAIHRSLQAMAPEGVTLSLGPTAIGRLLEQPPESKLGDYALPCFRFAKDLKKKPPEVAAALAAALPPSGWLDHCEVVGAFLNLFTNKKQLAETTLCHPPTPEKGEPERALKQRVMIEYSQPNTHKEFHVGHSRNVCLGNSLVRLYRRCGYEVTSANYFGDEGTHIACVLWYIDAFHKQPTSTKRRGEWLGKMYAEAKQHLATLTGDAKDAAQAGISAALRAIESQSGKIADDWRETRQWSLDDFNEIYDWLGVQFDVLFYESGVSEASQQIVDEYLQKGVFQEDQGAIGVDLKDFKLGFCILRKRDGNTLYATKDLVLAKVKFDQYKIDRSIYIVGDEQNHHFRQVFKVLELMGFPQAKACHHLSYGMVVLPEGKMSSRDGTAVSFLQLRDMMLEHLTGILKKYEGEWPATEITETAKRLCDGALKYGMVSTDPAKEIVFNMEDWLSFEGNSGPYLMYAFTRTQSILRKAQDLGFKPDASQFAELKEPSEHDLLRFLYDFGGVVVQAAENYKPSLLATHLFQMCKAFNRFYVDVPVLKSASDQARSARLALIAAFSRTLSDGLALLGITPPERM